MVTPEETTARQGVARRMAAAAGGFLSALQPSQLEVVRHGFPDAGERERWFYTPTDHGGLTIADMSPQQQASAFRLLGTGLSEAGYNTVATIMGLEGILDRVEGHNPGFGHGRARDPQRYYMRVFGDPGTGDWGWRFGGHHVSVNHTIVSGALASGTPSFLGADPATSSLLGPHPLRPLAGVLDAAYDLLDRFDPAQAAVAVVAAAAPTDTVGANRSSLDTDDPLEALSLADVWRDRFDEPMSNQLVAATHAAEAAIGFGPEQRNALRLTRTPIGLPAAEMTSIQRDLLRGLLSQYTHRLPDAVADLELAKISGDRFDSIHFAWAGPTEPGRPMYYRIQGDDVVVELGNTQRDANHIHSVWRNPKGDFGRNVLADHLRHHPHH